MATRDDQVRLDLTFASVCLTFLCLICPHFRLICPHVCLIWPHFLQQEADLAARAALLQQALVDADRCDFTSVCLSFASCCLTFASFDLTFATAPSSRCFQGTQTVARAATLMSRCTRSKATSPLWRTRSTKSAPKCRRRGRSTSARVSQCTSARARRRSRKAPP